MKKFLSLLNIVLLVFSSVWTDQFLVYASLEIGTFTIKNVAAATYSFNPGDRFSMDLKTSNTLSEAIKQTYVKLSFGNNAGFSYAGVDERTRINNVVITNPVPSNAYNSTTGLSFEITNGSTTQIGAGVLFDFSRGSNSHTGFVVASNISTYSNILTSWYEAQKVSDSSAVVGAITSKTIYVNVKPHITDYTFSKSSIVGNGSDSTDLTVKVKDYNGCSNIDGGVITANLSSLGLSSTESLTYNSCDVDGKTAIFKKVGITTLSAVGDKTFSYGAFAAKDEDNNSTDPTDANTTFDDEDKKTDVILTVATPNAPVTTISSTTPSIVSAQSSTVSFAATQTGTYKVVINGDGACALGTIVTDWTNYDTAAATINSTILATGLNTGANTIYACVKNAVGDIGSANTVITKDTTAPAISNVTVNPANVVTNDPITSFQCSENGTYKVVVNAFNTGYLTATGATTTSVTLPNANISIGANTVTIYCRDQAGNEANTTTSVSKVALPPSMTSSGLTLTDNDTAWDGVDGRDLKVTWDSTIGATYSGFESYRIYILPQNTAFTGTYVGLVANSGATTWTGLSTTVNDSVGNPLSSGIYAVYIAIMGTSGQIGGTATATGTMVADVIPHPSVLSASFNATGSLRVKFDTTLQSSTGSHSATGFTYQVGAITYTGTSVTSVASDTINIAIPDLGSTSATGVLSLATGAVLGTSSVGAINYGTGGIVITDVINPNIVSFATGTTAYYSNFYSGSLVFNYNVSENLVGAGDTKIVFTRVGGNADTLKTYSITTPGNLTSGAHSQTIDLVTLGLVSGVYYNVTFVVKDLAGNTTTSSAISVKFDNSGPTILSITPFGPQGIQGVVSPTFAWVAPTDDSGNGSGIKGYKLRVYTGSTTYTSWHSCTGAYNEYTIASGSQLSSQITLANLYNYAWSAYAYDNMENIGTTSSCDTFYINTNVPSFSLASITDTVLSSTTYTKGGNNLIIKSTITNTDSGHIWLNASSIKDSSYANILCSSPVSGVTCSYSSNIATYTFSAGALGSVSSGVKQAQFTATNIAGINTGTALASITLDNTAPVIAASTIISPISGTYGGTGVTISWTAGNITDNIGISYVKLDYTSDGTNWNTVGTGANSGSYPWNITALTSGATYKVRISAYDGVGLSSTFTGGTFSLDKIAPVMPSTSLTYPSASGIKVKGGTNINITWNSGSITDNIGLATNPIAIYYSIDSGSNYTLLATAEANDGTYSWAVPAGLNNTTMKIKLEASDTVGNISNDVSDNVFTVDSVAPSVTISYAGNGGSTPQSNSFINNSGFDVSASMSDTNLAGGAIYYSLYDQTANKYYNGTTYTGSVEVWNLLTTATGAAYNLASTITSSITNGDYYKFKLRADDIVGNTFSTPQVTFVGDIVGPALTVTTASGTYLSGSLTIAGTSSDSGSAVSSVNLEIKKGATWWNGTSWVGSQQLLVATTANSYANWSYVFNAPVGDNDGQAYTITVTARDNAYKTNNSTSSTITVIKDSSGPAIAAGVWTTVINGIQKDGNVLNLTWNTGLITSTGAGINNTNSIVLKFNNGAGIATITGTTANDGSHSYTLPTGDTQNAFFTIEAYDTLGNISNLVSSSGFTLDSTPPTISSVETIENTLGQINGVNIYLSELVTHSSIRLSNFSIAGVTGMSTGTISNVGTGTIFVINFTNTGTTATLPSLTYTAGSLTDLSGKSLATVTKVAIDKAPPRFTSAEIYDTNGNGKVDRIIAYASENLSASTNTSSWTINSPLAGVSVASASVSGSSAILTLAEPTVANTSTGGMTLSFANNGSWKDSSNNIAGNTVTPLSLIDKAPPVRISSSTRDVNSNGKIDGILLTFSETTSGGVGSNFSFTGLSTLSTYSNSIVTSGTTITLSLSETSLASDTATTPSFSYSGTSVKDASNNTLANISSTLTTDGVAPKILTRKTLDQDGNGYIDTIRLGLSENISGTGGVTATVSTYAVSSYTICNGNTTDLCVGVSEKSVYDGDQTPNIQITTNSTLGDSSGNKVATEGSATAAVDTVGPVVIGARYDAGATGGASDDVIYITFSESVSGATIDTTNATTDFAINGGGSLTSATVSNISGNTAEIHLGASSTALTPGTSLLSIKTGAIADALSNISPSEGAINRTTVNASVVINEVMFSSTVANQYIELQNLGSTSVSLSGWTITNAGVTLPSGASIAGNGYYLITNSAVASSILSGSITPNFVSALLSLNATTQSNLVLKNPQNVIFDSTKASPWPAGSGALNKAMERVSYPGDGLSPSNWYSAVASVGFDTTTPKGSPGSANIFDSTSPVISSVNVVDNTLFPLGNISLVYNYSDNIEINTGSRSLGLEKWNGASWSGITLSTTSSDITSTQATYTTTALPFGKYRTTFSIQDTTGNTATKVSIFYVDQFSLTVSTGSINIGRLSPGAVSFATPTVTVTIKTVGAGFNLSLGGSGTMNALSTQMAAWSGTLNQGYGFDWSESGSGTIKALSGTLSAINPTTLATYSLSPDTNGNQKTYIYTIKYGSKINSLQAAGVYQSLTKFTLNPVY